MMLAFEHASRATKGARSYQEDTALFWSGEGEPPQEATSSANGGPDVVAVLADGMGGHAGGALASRMACETSSRPSAGTPARTASASSRRWMRPTSPSRRLSRPIRSCPAWGSTLVGVTFGPHGVEWVSVGDSPLMLYRRGEIALLNEDHSLAPELDRLAKAGRISEEDARRDPRRHMLRSAVTGDEIDLVDLSMRPLQVEPGDYIILASDGLQTLDAAGDRAHRCGLCQRWGARRGERADSVQSRPSRIRIRTTPRSWPCVRWSSRADATARSRSSFPLLSIGDPAQAQGQGRCCTLRAHQGRCDHGLCPTERRGASWCFQRG